MIDHFPPRKLRLADAGNTRNPALEVIRAKGYQIYLYPDERDDFPDDYWAIKDGRDFIASDPLSLLGLIAMWEHMGDGWYHREGRKDIRAEVENIAFPEDDTYVQIDEETFRKHTAHLKPFFDALRINFEPETITREDLLTLMRSFYKSDFWKCDDDE